MGLGPQSARQGSSHVTPSISPEAIRLLERIFGAGEGATPEERARHSSKLFVRSIDALAEMTPGARGRQLSAIEALQAYGYERVAEAVIEGTALLATSPQSLGLALQSRRTQLGLDIGRVATHANVDPSVVMAAEQSRRVPVREVERIARILGLDDRQVGVSDSPIENERVAVRLRTLRDQTAILSQSAVAALAEAAWVAMTQIRLEATLGATRTLPSVATDDNYGTPGAPPYRVGYLLAKSARDTFALGDTPIRSMRDLAEQLGVPVIQTELGESVAGATVDSGGQRAIVVNTVGRNRRDPCVRRATIAHELEHLLYDPPSKLNSLRVDDYHDIDSQPEANPDAVEQRANAFAAEMLAPQIAAVQCYHDAPAEPVRTVMSKFGVSYSVARYQIWNGLGRSVPFDELVAAPSRYADEWDPPEAFTVDYFPIKEVRPSRCGRFSAIALLAAEKNVISWDTAAEYLETSPQSLRLAAPAIKELFPAVFAPGTATT